MRKFLLNNLKINHLRHQYNNYPPIKNECYKNDKYKMTHSIYDLKEIENVNYIYYEPKTIREK